MADVSSAFPFGLRFVRLGSAADLQLAAPLVDGDTSVDAGTDATRIGVYFDRTVSNEKVGVVVMGTDVLAVYADRVEVLGEIVTTAAYVTYTAIPDTVPTVLDTTAVGSAWRWTIVFKDVAGACVAVDIQSAVIDANTVDTTILPPTAAFPHTIAVTRAAGVTTLTITASGVGFTASARRTTMP